MSAAVASSGGEPGAEAAASEAAVKRTPFDLGRGCELRIESAPVGAAANSDPDEGSGTKVKLLSGSCEIFGTELAEGQTVDVTGQNVAVYTYHGAKLEVIGPLGEGQALAYVVSSDETPMMQYANIHAVLHTRREAAASSSSSSPAPRVLVAGPVDVGKSTLTRILTNYAVRSGHAPLLLDLDIGQGGITVPGTLSCVMAETVCNVETGEFSQDNALSFFYGHATPSENIQHYKVLVERMAAILEAFMAAPSGADANGSAGGHGGCTGGMFVNTMGWVDGDGLELLVHSIETLKVDTVLVVGHDRLYAQLTQGDPKIAAGRLPANLQVVKVAKSGGVVSRDSVHRKLTRERRVFSYFYGPRRELSPFSRSVQISQLQVFRVGGGPQAPLSALPIGTEKGQREDPKMKVTKMNVQRDLTHSVLAVSHARTPEEVLASNVAGFIHVTEVDVQKGILTYLSPSPGHLPSPVLIAGTIKCFLK